MSLLAHPFLARALAWLQQGEGASLVDANPAGDHRDLPNPKGLPVALDREHVSAQPHQHDNT